VTGERIGREHIDHQGGEPVDLFAHVGGTGDQIHLRLRAESDHDAVASRNTPTTRRRVASSNPGAISSRTPSAKTKLSA
jgi:hypothetical protein